MSIWGMGIETRSLPLRPMSSPCEMYLRRFCRILPRTMARKREWSWSILSDISLESTRSRTRGLAVLCRVREQWSALRVERHPSQPEADERVAEGPDAGQQLSTDEGCIPDHAR